MTTFEILFTCPDLMNQEDQLIIGQTLDGSPGINDIDVDFAAKRVRVTTANQDGGVDVRAKLVAAGFPPSDWDVREIGHAQRQARLL